LSSIERREHVQATDADDPSTPNANITYHLDGAAAQNFSIDEYSGRVRPLPPGIDRDKMTADYLNLTVIAKDGGYPLSQQSLATLIVVVNVGVF
jgi:hypothetical protein